jgi:hypothetical protein
MARLRGPYTNYRFVNNAMAAMLGALIVALGVDIAIDAEWIADLFFLVFAGSLVVFYRGRFAPERPPGLGLTALAWILIATIVAGAVLRVADHVRNVAS